MKKEYIGADLSKKNIDLASHLGQQHLQIENSLIGFNRLLKWFELENIRLDNVVIVMEHTGLYSLNFEKFLTQHQIPYVKVAALAIKRSLGLTRGKTDKKDSFRIAAYGYEKRNQLLIKKSSAANMERLQLLYSSRERLVKHKAGLLCAVKEYMHIGIQKTDILLKSQLTIIAAMEQQIEILEDEIQQIVSSDDSLNNSYRLLISIKGIGKVLAIASIIKTENFTRFSNARKFACFCGTAPFEHSSGSSIRGRTRVSHLADKKMKVLLDLSAKSALQHDPELKQFYERRTLAGKPKMSTINIIRNKIIYRMFAVIKRQTPFEQTFTKAA